MSLTSERSLECGMKSPVAVYHGPKNVSGQGVTSALTKLGIPFCMITGEDICAGRLAEFPGVIFPGGHSIVLPPMGIEQTRAYVRRGGGFLGICAGCQFACRLRLLPVEHSILRAAGIFDMRIVLKHPVTAGYDVAGRHRRGTRWSYSNRGRVRVRYNNGGVLRVGRGARVAVSFDEHGDLGAIVVGRSGRGRVVLMTPHPESTPPAGGKQADMDSDQSQDPLELFGNAVRYVCS
jgi:glutamine amidotransferase-like uncharacterized protein